MVDELLILMNQQFKSSPSISRLVGSYLVLSDLSCADHLDVPLRVTDIVLSSATNGLLGVDGLAHEQRRAKIIVS